MNYPIWCMSNKLLTSHPTEIIVQQEQVFSLVWIAMRSDYFVFLNVICAALWRNTYKQEFLDIVMSCWRACWFRVCSMMQLTETSCCPLIFVNTNPPDDRIMSWLTRDRWSIETWPADLSGCPDIRSRAGSRDTVRYVPRRLTSLTDRPLRY